MNAAVIVCYYEDEDNEEVFNCRHTFHLNGWNTPQDFKTYVHPHWLKYEAPNPYLHYMLGVFYIFLMFGSLIGNGVVIYIFTS